MSAGGRESVVDSEERRRGKKRQMGKDKGQKRKSWRGCPAWDPALRGSRRVCRSMLPFWRKRPEVGIVLRSSSVLREAGGPRPRRGSMPRPWPSDGRSGLGSARALPPEASVLAQLRLWYFDRPFHCGINLFSNYFFIPKKHLVT